MNQRRQAQQAQARNVRRAARNAAPRLRILPYGPSDSVVALLNKLNENEGITALRLSRENSQFRGRDGDLVVNWGNSTMTAAAFAAMAGQARVLNDREAVARSSNKKVAFQAMEQGGVKQVEFTTDRAVAQQWMDAGGVVYARTRLQGHSGEGIVVCTTQGLPDLGDIQTSRELVQAQLYTKGITAQRREFRVHVMGGQVIYVQQKKRTADYRDNANYSNVVRNYHTGWIYATENVQINDAGATEAIKAVAALGLDFGAVDVITRGNEAWVLEVNTAPGLQGTNLDNYANAIKAIFLGEEVVPVQRVAELNAGLEQLAEEAQAPEFVAGREMAREVMDQFVAEFVEAVPHPAPEGFAVNNNARIVHDENAAAIIEQFRADFNRGNLAPEPMRPAPIPAPVPAPVREPAIVDVGPLERDQLEDMAVYAIKVDFIEGNTVGVFLSAQNCFYVIGWDVPLHYIDVVVVRKIADPV